MPRCAVGFPSMGTAPQQQCAQIRHAAMPPGAKAALAPLGHEHAWAAQTGPSTLCKRRHKGACSWLGSLHWRGRSSRINRCSPSAAQPAGVTELTHLMFNARLLIPRPLQHKPVGDEAASPEPGKAAGRLPLWRFNSICARAPLVRRSPCYWPCPAQHMHRLRALPVGI